MLLDGMKERAGPYSCVSMGERRAVVRPLSRKPETQRGEHKRTWQRMPLCKPYETNHSN